MMKLSSYNDALKSLFPPTLKTLINMDGIPERLLDLCYVDYVYDGAEERTKCLFFVNTHVFLIDGIIMDKSLLEQIEIIKNKIGLQNAIVFNLNINELMELQSEQMHSYSFLYFFECNVEKFIIKSNYRRKARKAASIFSIKSCPDKNDICNGLELYYKMDFAYGHKCTLNKEKFVSFYLNYEAGIKILCYRESEIVGIMLGFLWNKKSYMHIFFYNPKCVSDYISDYMYQEFIRQSKYLGAESVVWGDVSFNDKGLYDFKHHYSTEITKKYFCVI